MKVNKFVWWNIGVLSIILLSVLVYQLYTSAGGGYVVQGDGSDNFFFLFVLITFCLGVLSFLLVPIFSIVSLVKIKSSGEKGKTLSIITLGTWTIITGVVLFYLSMGFH